MSSQAMSEVPRGLNMRRVLRSLGFCLALAFLLANLAARAHALHHAAGPATLMWDLFLGGVALATALALLRPALVSPALALFGASFFLYGFHSYRLQSQAFELLVTALAFVLLLRLARGARARATAAGGFVLPLFGLYALLATFSVLLLPPAVLEHRAFLEGGGTLRALLNAFPKDPLYPIASVNRLWLFLLFAWLLSLQADSRLLYRALVRGIAWAALIAVMLGLLDFLGVFPLARYNLSHLFYGARYRRLQSSFGNPSWFASFVSVALPFVLLELWQAGRRYGVLLTLFFPLCAASLVLSGARASWLAGLVLLGAFTGIALVLRHLGRPLPIPSRITWLALGSAVLSLALLLGSALARASLPAEDAKAPAGRLEGLSREIQIRGLGLTSPRRVATAYALELAKQKPLLGLGYESFNMHLRAQLEIAGSGVSKVINTGVARDVNDTVFDDSHNTYLQVLTGTGALGLAFWLALAGAGLSAAARALRHDSAPEALAVLLGLLLFHFYGLFQGMAYIPVTFFVFPLLTGYASTFGAGLPPASSRTALRAWLLAACALALVSAVGYASDSGYSSLKRRFGVSAYLPDEAAEFEGFYRPETGPAGGFRWMARRGIVNVTRAQPFRLRFTCEHPDAEREPVVLRLRFEGHDAGQIVFRRPGAVEQRFAFGSAGALRLSVSRTFRPAALDRRELGVAVSAIRWE